MSDKAEKMKARLPRGFVDRTPADIRATERMMEKIREVYERYGFEPVETPLVEYTDALGKFLPDQDRPNEGVFSFQDDDEQWLSLRYDLTAPLARYVAENWERLPKPYRSYRAGWVFRNEKPGPGRFRQFMQFDADSVGVPSVAADAEMAMMMADVMEALGIARGDYVIRVNNRKVLDGVLEAIGLGGPENAGRRLTVLRALDKKDRLGIEGVKLLLGPGRRDESGDFTKGADLSDEQIAPLIRYIDFNNVYNSIQQGTYDEVDTQFPNPFTHPPGSWVNHGYADVDRLAKKATDLQKVNPSNRIYKWSFGLELLGEVALLFDMNDTLAAGLRELAEIEAWLQVANYVDAVDGDNSVEERVQARVLIDPSVVRGLEYYTGPVYEAELTFPVTNEDGEVVRFGSVGGGGRYDGLVSRFRGEPVPACGFSIGVSRLMTALKNLGKLEDADAAGPVVVLAMDRDTESLGRTQRLVATLREAGVKAEMYLGGAGMKAQMKYADRRNAPCVVIQGSDERARGEVQIKDLVEGKRLSEGIADNREWREGRVAQVTVSESGMVEAVRRILDAQRQDRAMS